MTNSKTLRMVQETYSVAYPNPIKLRIGESVCIEKWEPQNSEWAGWAFCVDCRGIKGWVSEKYLKVEGESAFVVQDYDATELDVTAGESVWVQREEFGWARVKNERGLQGWIPVKILR